MADTAALVVALSAQLTKFEKDLQKAGIMAERAVGDIENKFSKMNPKISTSFFGNLFAQFAGQAITAGLDAIKGLADRFTELSKNAELAGVSMNWLYGVQAVGEKAGASIAEMNAALRSVAFSLDEIQRGGTNALKELFDAPKNVKFLKGVKAEALDTAGAFKVLADILGGMKLIQAVDVGQKLGISEAAVRALRMGGDELERLGQKASKSLPDLKKMEEQIKLIKEAWSVFAEAVQIAFIDDFFNRFKAGVAQIIQLLEAFSNSQEGTTIMGRAADRALDNLREIDKILSKPTSGAKRIEITGGGSENPFARKRGGDAGRDEFERANDSITKHIALMNADTKAVGQSVYEQERLKTEATLMEGVRRKLNLAEGEAIPLNEELAAKIKKQAEASGQAALANAEAKYKLQQLNAASQQLGSALSTAFTDAVLEGKKLNEVLDALLKTLAKAAINSSIMSLFTPGASGINPFLSFLGLQGKMAGGPVNAGQPYMVGEAGPELMVPGASGMVVPNSVLGRGGGGSSQSVVYNINAAGADSGTVVRIQAVLASHARSIEGQARAFASAQSLQATGVMR